ncbi:very-short-patch-repair endonuclease [Saccharothrix coeruleofusca]|uniref:AAA domain-containing protein n=1 Tax=Saccharothrix coeruleofusca TaxID=33919 RepID=UPI0027DE490B|nr:AAA domain-containing protein [Saccharothrix coeruleofusca]MBP2335030.1 very-short-patch-repair endonuclease [Saccharothrix coeruleofusca]
MASNDAAPDQRGAAVDRAIRLFQFLARSQQLKSNSPRTTDSYDSVLWFGRLPEHPAIRSAHRAEAPEAGDALLVVERVPHQEPPEPAEELRPWLDGAWDDPDDAPRLRESIGEGERRTALDDAPEIREAHAEWEARWTRWAERERADRPAREVYNDLFSTYVTATGHGEELELVVGAGCLSWSPPGHPVVRRHLATAPAVIHFDDATGRLAVHQAEAADGLNVELDMLDPGRVANPQHVARIRNEAREVTAAALHRGVVGEVLRKLVHALDGDAAYVDEDDVQKPGPHAVAAFAPALVLRRRSRQGIVDILDSVAAQLGESGVVPDGLLPLVDPDHRPAARRSPEPGALVELDTEPFLPLPVNERQLRVLTQVDAKAQTLVQGPPGTGKTHTVAALLSHLLAQGKRVLVTAHTDRALKEVRAKLPEAIAPLAVSVVGSSRSDLADLKVAVERISDVAGEYDAGAARRAIDEHLAAIEALRARRAGLYRRLLDARGEEVTEHEVGDYRGTLAAIARRVEEERERFGWLADLVTTGGAGPSPVPAGDIAEWHRSVVDDALIADEPEARLRLLPLTDVPAPEEFFALVIAERRAIEAEEGHGELTRHTAFDAVRGLDQATRTALRQRLNGFAREAEDLSRRREEWMDDALSDVLSGRANHWRSRGNQVAQLIGRVEPLVDRLGPLTEVRVGPGDTGALVALAGTLRTHVGDGGGLKTNPDGSPKIGAFTSKAVKQAQPLFQAVRVNGVPPTTADQFDAFLMWAEATRALDALDRAWPDSVRIPAEDTLSERLQWHVTELAQLRRVLALGEALEAEERGLAELGLPRPNWDDLDAVQTYARLVDAAAASDARTAATLPLLEVARTTAEVARWADAAPCVRHLARAAEERDHESYAVAHHRLVRLTEVAGLVRRRDEIAAALARLLPRVHEAVSADPRDPAWAQRLADWDAAWAWAVAREWVLGRGDADVNALQAEVLHVEEQVRGRVERLAAERAWAHAVSPERLSGKARADLLQYAQLVKLLGKGTGVYAEQRRADIKAAMDRCRPAVPVWIMPIYRIAEQFRVQPDMFDVVIVDEASQAGLEATFLQYLAPKIVVIGDDKQVSPTAVGVDRQQLRDLADQYLWDDPYRATWQEPKYSLFDHAKKLFEGMITLVEHRRCVPEIIGFSNRIAYEPDGIRLVPVRQYGADRLEPVKPVFLDNGYERGSTDKVNPVEADAIVDQIEKCVADPRYDGLTFGVVSLLGRAQAKAIEKRLLERIPPEEWRARELRCGDSADFQGSERDVMFLSMVKAAEPGKRIGALTQDMYVQRFNVAASRAKDQMWVFHSLRLSDLGNPEDMRFQLLDYCYALSGRAEGVDGARSTAVPEDRKVEPFDSLFEQRVFNRLVDRGYSVVPQFPAQGYRIDLVVVGAKARLAVECDGDAWHGPDAYERDMARQRDLERCGWRFFRIRESEFYADRPAVLARLWDALHELEIHPSGWTSDGDDPSAGAPAPEAVAPEPVVPEPVVAAPRPVVPEPAAPVQAVRAPVAVAPAVVERIVEHVVEHEDELPPVTVAESVAAPVGGSVLAPYEEFDGTVIQVGGASRRELLDGLVRIVAAEGPVLGSRLHTAYVRASGSIRVTKQIAGELNKAISQAVREGKLVEDNPLRESWVRARTYRLPDQPEVRTRHLGPRSLDEVPPSELAALLDHVAERNGNLGQEASRRAVLELLGLKRLTDNVRSRFVAVEALRS